MALSGPAMLLKTLMGVDPEAMMRDFGERIDIGVTAAQDARNAFQAIEGSCRAIEAELAQQGARQLVIMQALGLELPAVDVLLIEGTSH